MRVRTSALVAVIAVVAMGCLTPKQSCDLVEPGAPASTLLELDYKYDLFCSPAGRDNPCGPSRGPCRAVPDAGTYFLRVGPIEYDRGAVYGCCVHVVDDVIEYKTVRDE